MPERRSLRTVLVSYRPLAISGRACDNRTLRCFSGEQNDWSIHTCCLVLSAKAAVVRLSSHSPLHICLCVSRDVGLGLGR